VFTVGEELRGRYARLKILKSRFDTQIILNGHDCGTFMQCSSPIEASLTGFVRYGEENVLLVRVGDRAWLSPQSALGVDREKTADFPGIWDDIAIVFTGPVSIDRVLALPNLAGSCVDVKLALSNRSTLLERDLEYASLSYTVHCTVREKSTRLSVGSPWSSKGILPSQGKRELHGTIALPHPHRWSPADPFLYEVLVRVVLNGREARKYGNPENTTLHVDSLWVEKVSDEQAFTFGFREFAVHDTIFTLNGREIRLYGSTITLDRFFEDRERARLPWDTSWVERLLVDIPKAMGWNALRVSLGLLPSFWYDLADKHGLLIQNEFPMWGMRGGEDQIRREYTDWVWADGNHPSIVIWDALNEQEQSFVGQELIPHLRELDPTRIWDAGWTSRSLMKKMDMEEVHWYSLGHGWWLSEDRVREQRMTYRFGVLDRAMPSGIQDDSVRVPRVVNEYGWLWLERGGRRTSIRTHGSFRADDIALSNVNFEYFEPDGSQLYHGRDIYEYYLGANASPEQRMGFQAYLLGIETEALRSSRRFAGVISFPYLTNNAGYTGDWFLDSIRDLRPAQALLIQYHAMREVAAFISLEDGRYVKPPKIFDPGSRLSFEICVVNDTWTGSDSEIRVMVVDVKHAVVAQRVLTAKAHPMSRQVIPMELELPQRVGGYMLVTEFMSDPSVGTPQISRRYFRIGNDPQITFPEYTYALPPLWPATPLRNQ
jgi:hypothetical protein